jgi:hypothetical protein
MLAGFFRLLRKVWRLRHLEEEMARLRAELEELRNTCTAAHTRLANQHQRLRELQDMAKSRLEVPRALLEEFQSWKMDQPIPAEPLVSVCVSTYNRARLLTERCLPSILAQSYPRLQVIVVGDRCDDDTEQRVQHIGDPRLVFVNLPLRPHYPADAVQRWMVAGTQAVNTALALARGDFITHLDDDDEYLPQRLEKLVHFARTERCDFIWHPFWAQAADGQWSLNEARDLAPGQVTTSSVFYRSWFRRIGWDPEAYLLREPGDWNRIRKLKFLGACCRRHPEALLRHYKERNQPVA